MTTKGEWVDYTGSDEQIGEIRSAKNGYIFRYDDDKKESYIHERLIHTPSTDYLHEYWIIPDDPLREMKIRQSKTGQPVWIRTVQNDISNGEDYYVIGMTANPDWNIPNAEYSFTAFEE